MESSADVAKWGAEWLRQWVEAAGSDDERSTREWLASGWENWSLEAWAAAWNEERRLWGGKSLSEFNADHGGLNHLLLYKRERNGLLIWRAFREYRSEGLPVPEVVLAKFDAWGERLERASGIKEIAAAIEMTGPKGGPKGAKHINAVEGQRRVVSAVALLVKLGMPLGDAYKRVAKERRKTVGAVRLAYMRWIRKDESRAEAETSRVLRTLGSTKER